MPLSFFRAMPKKAAPTVEERTHIVGERVLPLKVVENDRARRLTLRLAAGGGLRVTVPRGIAPREIDRFLERHEGWISERIARLPKRPQVRPGIKIPIRGKPHRIVHEPDKRGAAETAMEDGEPVLIVHGDRRHLPRRIADFLKREAKRDIETLVAKHAATVGRRATSIRYKDTTSRWGSCSSSGTLSFSWRIMMAPPMVVDYLVAHEVAHLKEMNHGPRFWKLCRELCPETDRCKAWLKRNGNALQAIRFE